MVDFLLAHLAYAVFSALVAGILVCLTPDEK